MIPWNALYALDLFSLALFAISYYRNCYRKGYRIDIWHAQLFLGCVFPNLLMLPFARSELNVIILGNDFSGVVAAVPEVFLITVLGYFSMLAGGFLWRLRLGTGTRNATSRLLDLVPRASRMLMSSRDLLIFQSLLCLLLQGMILAVYFTQSGFGFDLRAYTMANPALRPVSLLASNYSVVIASHSLARYMDKRERTLLACTVLLTFGLVFFGARGNILAIYINVLLCYLVKLRSRIGLLRILGITSFILLSVLYLGNVRDGKYSIGEFFGTLATLLLFGNTFSDLRDFAWVYSGWNHEFWLGKTYLAALMAFIPRVASQFRDTWGLGVATATSIGLDPQVHPGLRPGLFGEGFFNFGWLGAATVGLVLGVIIRRVDIDVKRALGGDQPSMITAFASTMLLGVAADLAITAGFSSLYILGGIYLFSWLCLSVGRLIQPRRVLVSQAN